MKLRNKKNGKVYTACRVCFYEPIDDVEKRNWKTLKEFCEDWEDYTPKEPLIKDEKIRKAVRAWADMNDIRYIEPCARSSKDNYRIVGFNALGRSFTMELSNEYECRITMGQALSRKNRNAYAIAELCGEDEE